VEKTPYRVQDFESLISSEEDEQSVASVLEQYMNYDQSPSKLEMDQVKDMMELSSSSRNSYFRYVRGMYDKEGNIVYGMYNNTIINTFNVSNSLKGPGSNLLEAALYGQPLVLDFGYDSEMRPSHQTTLATQIQVLYGYNRGLTEPFDLHFCNYLGNPRFSTAFKTTLHIKDPDEAMITATQQSYLELFPKERLVYLTPHAEEVMTSFDPQAVYIIGAFVDTLKGKKVSNVRAAESGLKALRFPLDEQLDWGVGNKCLNVNHVAMILMDMKSNPGLTFKEALLKHIPSRKLKTPEEVAAIVAKRRAKRELQEALLASKPPETNGS
jgi:ribonuclease P protein 1